MARNPQVQQRVFRDWYARNRDAVLAKQKEWRESEMGRAYRWRRTLSKHGLTQGMFDQMWSEQDGGCAGCLTGLVLGPSTHIDHCHTTGNVRGLLCSSCNLALGKVMDDPATLRRLAAYLERSAKGCRG